MTDIHRAGRKPKTFDLDYLKKLLEEYETMTTRQMGELHGVSQKTIMNHLNRAREAFAHE